MQQEKSIIVKTRVAPLYIKPTFKSELVTQALIWENLIILNKKNNWYKVKQWDNYISWIHNSYVIKPDVYLDYSLNNDHDWYYFIENKINNSILSFGSCIPVIEHINSKKCKAICPDGKIININKNYLIKYKNKLPLSKLVLLSLKLLKTPYLWGGKSSMGYDCSGLVQIILRMYGLKFPRDCSEQINFNNMKEINLRDSSIGNLIYFSSNNKVCHVGIFIDEDSFIHSSGFVKINSINKSHKLFNNKLFKLFDSVYRIN